MKRFLTTFLLFVGIASADGMQTQIRIKWSEFPSCVTAHQYHIQKPLPLTGYLEISSNLVPLECGATVINSLLGTQSTSYSKNNNFDSIPNNATVQIAISTFIPP